jgi:hypothetical protein
MTNWPLSVAIFFRLERNVSCEIRLSQCQVERRHGRNMGMLIESEIILKLVIGIGIVTAMSEVFKTVEVRQSLFSAKCKWLYSRLSWFIQNHPSSSYFRLYDVNCLLTYTENSGVVFRPRISYLLDTKQLQTHLPLSWCSQQRYILSGNNTCCITYTLPPPWRNGPKRARVSSFLRLLDQTEGHITGGTPLDEWSACHTTFYLTTHHNNNRQTSMPPARFEPTVSAGELPQT